MLKNANISATLDVTNLIWVEQIQFISSSLIRAIEDLSGIQCTAKELGAKRVDKSGRGSNIKTLIRIPVGADNAESYQNGSDVGHALINPRFKSRVDSILAQLSGQSSSILEIDISLSKALEVKAPGLIIGAETPSTVPISLSKYRSTEFYDIYTVAPSTDLAVNGIATLNYTKTPLTAQSGADIMHSSLDEFYGINGITDPLIGDWKFTGKDTLTDLAGTPVLTDFDFEIVSAPTPSFLLKKDGVSIYSQNVTLSSPATSMFHRILLRFGGRGNTFNIVQSIQSGILSAPKNVYGEDPFTYKEISALSRSLEVTNKTAGVIQAGTPLGRLQVQIGGIAEII